MITQKLINLTNAMAEFEGWNPQRTTTDEKKDPSVSYRNHNPGNLRFSIFALGIRDGFAYFFNDATGMFAMRFDIMKKCQGKTITTLLPDSILADLIKIYSASEGDSLINYVKHVCQRTGFEPSMQIKDILT